MADLIRLTCPNGHAMKAPETARGKRMRCGVCKAVALVPDEKEESSDEPTENQKKTAPSKGDIRSGATKPKNVLYSISLGLAVFVAIAAGAWGVRNNHLANQISMELAAKDAALTAATKRADASEHSHSVALLKIGLLERTAAEDKVKKDNLELDITKAKHALDDARKQLKTTDKLYGDLKRASQNSVAIHNLTGAIYEAEQVRADLKSGTPTSPKEKDWKTLLLGTWTTRLSTTNPLIWGTRSFHADHTYTEAFFEIIEGEAKLSVVKLNYDAVFLGTKHISFNGKIVHTVESISESEMHTSGKLGKETWKRISHDPNFVITRHSLFKKWHDEFLRSKTSSKRYDPHPHPRGTPQDLESTPMLAMKLVDFHGHFVIRRDTTDGKAPTSRK